MEFCNQFPTTKSDAHDLCVLLAEMEILNSGLALSAICAIDQTEFELAKKKRPFVNWAKL